MECMEMKIGEIKEIGKVETLKYECVEGTGDCVGCAFENERSCYEYGVHYHLGDCSMRDRSDNTDIIFKAVV